MKKFIVCIGLVFFHFFVVAQYKVSFIISKLPSYHKGNDKIYLAGSFNNWKVKDEKLQLKNTNNKIGITIELPKGTYEYKFTNGGWDRVETLSEGKIKNNRRITVNSDTLIEGEIEHWAQHFTKRETRSTASKNVSVIDTAFFIPQLNRFRRVWIYLPASYSSTKKKYPVLYMHDGQNVFDEKTSAFGEWGVDETLDSLSGKHKEIIVVAIDNGGEKRRNEYSPYDMEKFGKGEGDQYVDFLAKTLKPFIDKKYRTVKCKHHTFIAGSSMGGLISFYAILKYPKVFGGAGVFSPAFWITPQMKNIDPQKLKKVKGKIYFYAGQLENENMVPDMLNVFGQMEKNSKAKIKTVIRAEGKHNESTWREVFPLLYKWLFP